MGEIESSQRPPQRSAPATRLFVVLTGIVTAAVIVASVIGFELWNAREPDPKGLPDQVVASMNGYLSADPDYSKVDLHVTAITIMHASGNVFEGQATVASSVGGNHSVPVHVMYDGDAMFWRTDSGAFAYTVREQMQGS
jgi:hypothetical protein